MHLTSSIIDNIDNNIGDIIKDNLTKSQQIQFAVWFLFLSGFKDIFPWFQELEKIQLLIGNRTDTSTAKTLWKAFENKLETPHEIEISKNQAKQDFWHDIGTEFQQTETDKSFLEQLYNIVKSWKLEIRIYTKATLHAKAYIFTAKPWSLAKWRCIVWSSNLSKSWFYDNTELNVVVDGDDNYDKMQDWFKRLRDESHDFTQDLLETIDNSWIKAEPTPYEVYMKILYEMVGKYVDNPTDKKFEWTKILYQFQIDAVHQAVEIVKKYNWVFVSDVVWLGKTYTGSIIMDVLTKEHHSRWLVLAPAKLIKEREKSLRKFGVNAEVKSIDGLHTVIDNSTYDNIKYVLVDESHKFKDPNTQRYPILQEFIHRTDKKLILLSATPLNLDGRDVYHQIKLFHKGEDTNLPISPNHLYQFFKKYENGEVELGNILWELMVRRTRLHIKRYYQKDMKRMDKWFPHREWPFTIEYNLNTHYEWIYDEIEAILWQRTNGLSNKQKEELVGKMDQKEREQYKWKLNYAIYFKTNYIKDEYFTINEKWNRKLDDLEFDDIQAVGENLKELAKITFYQRIESSPKAFLNTLDRMIRYNEIFLENLKNGYIFKTKHSAELEEYVWIFDDMDEEKEELLDLDKESYDIKKFDTEKYIKDVWDDIILLKKLREKANKLTEWEDIKMVKLIDILQHHEDKKILIFSQYSDTTNYIIEKLQKNFKNKKIAELSGNTKWDIIPILWNFSPRAQDYKIKTGEKEIDILVATDIISEWQNLQDADMIINYDLHWNPVKLIQRIGRIDRIGSTNDKIFIFNFYPSLTGEGRLGLRSKVSARVHAIHQHIGEENKIISQKEELNHKMIKLYEEMLINQKDTIDQIEETENEAQNIFVYSHLIKELQDCKDQHANIFHKIKKMPLRMRTAKKADESNMLVYCKYWDFDHCYILNNKWEIENNKSKFLNLVHADIKTKRESLPNNHDEKTTLIENQFHLDVEEQHTWEVFSWEKKTSMDMIALKNKIKKYQEEYLDKYEYEEHDKIDIICDYIESWMETWQKRKFKPYKQYKRASDFTTTIINQMVNIVEEIKENKIIKKDKEKWEKYVIISESLV